jgi:hypothetical protein
MTKKILIVQQGKYTLDHPYISVLHKPTNTKCPVIKIDFDKKTLEIYGVGKRIKNVSFDDVDWFAPIAMPKNTIADWTVQSSTE